MHLDYIEAEQSRFEWSAGDAFTAADIQMSFVVEAAAAKAGLDGSRPRMMASLDRNYARPAWARAVARGGAYDLTA